MEAAIIAIETKLNTLSNRQGYIFTFMKEMLDVQNAFEFLYHNDKEMLLSLEKKTVETLYKLIEEGRAYSCTGSYCEENVSFNDYRSSRVETWKKYNLKYNEFSKGLDIEKLIQYLREGVK